MRRASAGKRLLKAAEVFRARAGRRVLMVRTENLVKTAQKASAKYNAITLDLLGPNICNELKIYGKNYVEKGSTHLFT